VLSLVSFLILHARHLKKEAKEDKAMKEPLKEKPTSPDNVEGLNDEIEMNDIIEYSKNAIKEHKKEKRGSTESTKGLNDVTYLTNQTNESALTEVEKFDNITNA